MAYPHYSGSKRTESELKLSLVLFLIREKYNWPVEKQSQIE